MITRFCLRVHHARYSFDELLRLWRLADRLGYDGGSLYDVVAVPALEVWTVLPALVMATRRMVGIPLVLDVNHRHPVMTAKMAAALDVMSGGRLILGIGYGGNLVDHNAYGFPSGPMRDRVRRLEEHADIMRALWTQPRVTHQGEWFSLHDAPGFETATPGGPPILIAGRGERYALPGVARKGDLSNVSFDLSPDEWKPVMRSIAEHATAAGRDPSAVGLTHNATVVIAETRAEAERQFEQVAKSRNLTREQVRRGLDHALVGTPDEIIARLRAFEAAGVPLAWVFLVFPDLPTTRSVRLFAREVLPAFTRNRA